MGVLYIFSALKCAQGMGMWYTCSSPKKSPISYLIQTPNSQLNHLLSINSQQSTIIHYHLILYILIHYLLPIPNNLLSSISSKKNPKKFLKKHLKNTRKYSIIYAKYSIVYTKHSMFLRVI
jgi:hypothetical protein